MLTTTKPSPIVDISFLIDEYKKHPENTRILGDAVYLLRNSLQGSGVEYVNNGIKIRHSICNGHEVHFLIVYKVNDGSTVTRSFLVELTFGGVKVTSTEVVLGRVNEGSHDEDGVAELIVDMIYGMC